MTSSAILILAVAVAIFLLASLPTIWALGKAARRCLLVACIWKGT
jgi:hypothetical protein